MRDTLHGWWLVTGRGEHGRSCRGCRAAVGGPDHQDDTSNVIPLESRRRHRRR